MMFWNILTDARVDHLPHRLGVPISQKVDTFTTKHQIQGYRDMFHPTR